MNPAPPVTRILTAPAPARPGNSEAPPASPAARSDTRARWRAPSTRVASQGEPRLHDVGPVRAERPRGAPHVMARIAGGGGVLPGELGLAVAREGPGWVCLEVRLAALAGEAVVRRGVDHRRAHIRGRG